MSLEYYEHPAPLGNITDDTARRNDDAVTMFAHQSSNTASHGNRTGTDDQPEGVYLLSYSPPPSTVMPSGSVDRIISPEAPGRHRIGAAPAEVSNYGDAYGHANIPIDDGDSQKNSLVRNAAGFGHSDNKFQSMEYADPYNSGTNFPPPKQEGQSFSRFSDVPRYPLDQRIENKRQGIGRQRYPFVSWAISATLVCVFIYELVVNWKAQGTPVSLKPIVNPMLGPSTSALIHVGARFVPCMKHVQNLSDNVDLPVDFDFPCLNNTANPPDSMCKLSEVCGFGGFPNGKPNQWFRFFTPIFLHAGFVHLLLNLFGQMVISAQVEREMGSAGFFILYFAAGVFGNVLGANFARLGAPSTGASGAIFGTVAVEWVDLIFHWKLTYRPVRKLMFLIVDLIIGIAMGFIPFIDNFAHLGGLFMGFLAGIILYPVISTTRRHKIITWICRIAVFPIPIILFVVLTKNFYTSNPYNACSGCRYLSCIPMASNDHCRSTGLSFNGVQINY